MDMFVVRGGKPLVGRVAVSGAKNSALPIMATALAAEGPTVLHGVPDLRDVSTLCQLLHSLGLRAERRADGALELEVLDERPCVAGYDLVRRMRASVCVLGPMLARRGRACVSLPGGCAIGDRPIDLHLKGLSALGADLRVERGYVIAEARRLRAANIYLGGPFGSTVTGTCNVMGAAALADGVTTIEAAACEPEVVDLGEYLNAAGARISGLGTPFLRIEGVDRLHGAEHTVIPDRIEAATLMIAAAATGGRVDVENVRLDHMTAVVEKLREIGVEVSGLVLPSAPPPLRPSASQSLSGKGDRHPTSCGGVGNNPQHPSPSPLFRTDTQSLSGKGDRHPASCGGTDIYPQHPGPSPLFRTDTQTVAVKRAGGLQPADCIALPYPGIPTDVQAQIMALLTRAEGISIVTDKVFPDRFLHAPELVRMGARMRREGASAVISGVRRLSGACVMASDLRASAALVIAALAAEGESVIRRIYHLDRGYDRLERKLNALGADVRRVEDAPAQMPASLAPAFGGSVTSAPGGAPVSGPAWLRRASAAKSVRPSTSAPNGEL